MTRKKSSIVGSPDVAQIVAAMRSQPAKGRGQRSPLYLWLRQNHARLLEEFTVSAPSWPGLASALGNSGVFNGDGKPPTAEGVRTVWYRVRQELAGKRKATSSRTSPTPKSAIPPLPPAQETGVGGDTTNSPRRFGTVKLRGLVTDASAPGTTVPPDAARPSIDADDVLAKFMPGAAKRPGDAT